MDSRNQSYVFRELTRAFKASVHAHCERTGDTEDDVAAMLGIAKSHLNNMLNGHAPTPADLLVAWKRKSGDAGPVTIFCRLAGVACIAIPETASSESSILDLVREYTEAAQAAAVALGDGKVTSDELATCVQEIDEAIEAALRLKTHLQGVNRQAGRDGRAATLADAEKHHA